MCEKIEEFSSLERIRKSNHIIEKVRRGLPNPGSRPNHEAFYPDLQKINNAYLNGNEVYSKNWKIPENMIAFNSGNGSPFVQEAFLPAVMEGIEVLRGNEISQYPYASGDKECRCRVADYLSREGFKSNSHDKKINENQVIFFNSTTEAFSILMKVICRPGDVVLFTAPTYGLLAYAPERMGAISKFIGLKEEDNWLINPIELEKTIVELNSELENENKYIKYAYKPCVAAFVNINPNNPTGLVMGKDEENILEQISEVCKKNGVFVVDDIIYRDLCYDWNNKAVPVATIDGTFSNTITLFGTSKCYGLAGARAGAIVADECVIRGLRNELFQLMDSTSLLVSHFIAGAFNTSTERDNCYYKYFNQIIKKYKNNWKILKIIIDGEDEEYFLENNETCIVEKWFTSDTKNIIKNGITELSIAGNIVPEAGFFALVDFSNLLGRKDIENNEYLSNEIDILYYFYRTANVKLLMGDSFAWPVKKQIVARMSYAYELEDLIRMLYQIYTAVKKLEYDI